MDVPATVQTALEDRHIEGDRCLEAGAGTGNTTAGLLEAGASEVLAVTNERRHAETVSERVPDDQADRVRILEGDLRAIPVPDTAVGILTAHALFNVVPPRDVAQIAGELTRVAKPGAALLVDDYAPVPERAAIRDLFALENATMALADNRPAVTFYPNVLIRSIFEAHGWKLEGSTTLLDPVPWTESHVEAHAEIARNAAASIDGPLGDELAARADRLVAEIESTSIGEMYSLAFRLPD